MKKIISFLAAAMVMLSFSVVSHAEDNINVTISDATVELNASDATVNVKYTFDFPEEVSLLGFQPEVTFDKTALTLNSYTLSGDGVEWGVADSNLNKDYGAYLSFDDANLVGSAATKQYVMTLNFTVNDVKTAASYTVGLKELVGTNSDWGGITDNYGWVVAKEGTITVASPAPTTKTIGAKVTMDAPGNFNTLTGVLVTAKNKAGQFGDAIVEKAKVFDGVSELNVATVSMALNISDVDVNEELSDVTMAWYY